MRENNAEQSEDRTGHKMLKRWKGLMVSGPENKVQECFMV